MIQAYRQTHGGATPTPALVKQILVSTATDLGAPANEQGAGLLNSYRAVQLAESIPTPDGSPSPTGATLLKSSTQLNAVTGARLPQSVSTSRSRTPALAPRPSHITGRAIGHDQDVQTGSVTLSDTSSPQFANYQGLTNNYGTFTFNVAPGMNRLDGSIAYPGNPANGNNARVRLILIDPDRPAGRALAAAGRRQLRQRRRRRPGRGHLDRRDLRRRRRRRRHQRHRAVADRDPEVHPASARRHRRA